MAIRLSTEMLDKIDEAFDDILNKKNQSAALRTIQLTLSNCFYKDIRVVIIKPKRNAPFYMMSIFPNESTLDKLVQSILDEESDKNLKKIWDENKTWTIEIDNRLLTGSFIDVTGKELTALILHECGHVIYSNSIPQRMTKVMRYEYAKANIGTKNVLKNGIFKKILQIPILKACLFENYKTDANKKKELKADIFAVKMGYGDELDSVLDKIISKSSPNKDTGAHIDQSSSDVYDAMKSDTLFSINLVEDLKDRKANITKTKYQKMLLDIPSEYTSKILGKLETALFKGDGSKPSGVVESTIMDAAEYYYESAYTKEAFNVFKKKMERIDPATVDYIAVRKDDMKTNDDKLMLVTYIYGKLDLINYYLDIMDNPKYAKRYVFANSRNELLRMRDQLEKLKTQILEYRIPEVRYGIQIAYPDGYTG